MSRMEIIKLDESGYWAALYGLSLSFKPESVPFYSWWDLDKKAQMHNLAYNQAQKEGGHNKFLESIITWYSIKAPRGWWQEYDTYRLETKNSASTMHTIQKEELTELDFEEGTDPSVISNFNKLLAKHTNNFTNTKRLSGESLEIIKWNLPEGFLQTRQVRISYKTLRNMILQRGTHRLPQWKIFIDEIYRTVDEPQLLPDRIGRMDL